VIRSRFLSAPRQAHKISLSHTYTQLNIAMEISGLLKPWQRSRYGVEGWREGGREGTEGK